MNLSSNDRLVRVFGGFVMVGVEYISEFNWDVLLLAVGCWSLLTSAVGFCPFYKLFGHSTCPI